MLEIMNIAILVIVNIPYWLLGTFQTLTVKEEGGDWSLVAVLWVIVGVLMTFAELRMLLKG